MKLKDGFVSYDTEDSHILVPVGGQDFAGLVRSNETAAFIIGLLKKETDRDSVAQAMVDRYGIERSLAETDAEKVFEQLRRIGALDE